MSFARKRFCCRQHRERLLRDLDDLRFGVLDRAGKPAQASAEKLEDEIARFNIFQRSVLGSTDKVGNRKDTDIRNYAKYILKEINGYDLWNYYGVIDGIYKVNNRKENPMDLIQLSYELGKEYKLLNLNTKQKLKN